MLLLDEPTNHLDVEPDRVAEVFGVRSRIVPHPLTGRPHFVTASRPNGAEPA